MVGRGLGLLRGTSSGWCVRCSPGRESLENGGPADSRRQWLGPLTTDGQPCGSVPLAGQARASQKTQACPGTWSGGAYMEIGLSASHVELIKSLFADYYTPLNVPSYLAAVSPLALDFSQK